MTRGVFAATVVVAIAMPAVAPARAEIVEEIVAKVNDDIITKSEVEREEQALVAELYRRYTGDELDRQVKLERSRILQDMIDRKLLVHRAERLYDMDKMKKVLLDNFMEQQDIKDVKELDRLLAQQGLSRDDLERRLVEMAAPGEVVRFEVTGQLSVGDGEIESYYQAHPQEFDIPAEVKLREIVIVANKGDDRDERRAEAERAHERVTAEGQDFADVAREVSQAGSASQGGLIGPFKKGDLVKELEEAAFSLPVGSVSGVLDTDNGFHIIKVESRTEARTRSLDEVREDLRKRLEDQKYSDALQKFLKKARQEATIWVSPKYLGRFDVEIPKSGP
jgi:peptidyl-prolyl cis-trans isomerase SurA